MSTFTQVASLTDFTPSTTIQSAQVDANFAAIRDVVNALITGSNAINVDTIAEVSAGSGVTIDSVLLKDGGATLSAELILSTPADGVGAMVRHLSLKSADVAHGVVTNLAQSPAFPAPVTSDYLLIHKQVVANGGAQFTALMEDVNETPVLALTAIGGQASTSKTTAGEGLIHLSAAEHDGSGAVANVTADGSVLTVAAYVGGYRTVFIVDEDGDFFYDGADGGAFDAEDDAALVRAFALSTSKHVIRSEFDEFVRYNEADLVRLGILGDTVANGGLVNGAQLQRLLVGAVWQQQVAIEELRTEVRRLTA